MNSFNFANRSQKQQKAEIFLMLLTVILVLMTGHRNHASASAQMMLPISRSLKTFIVLDKPIKKNSGLVFRGPHFKISST